MGDHPGFSTQKALDRGLKIYHRKSFDALPVSDINHLKGDTARAYKLIVSE